MLKYLVILLDDTSASYCYYNSGKRKDLINKSSLRAAIDYAMKQNLSVQFVYPAYELPNEYVNLINTIDHFDIKPFSSNCSEISDIIVFNSVKHINKYCIKKSSLNVVLRLNKQDFFSGYKTVCSLLDEVKRVNVILTDVSSFKEPDFDRYKNVLSEFADSIIQIASNCKKPELNLLTDRILLDGMNNCNAGIENITLAPNGKFYFCPAFYYSDNSDSIGNLKEGLHIKNQQLLSIENAPICRICDAYQCKRCVWLNSRITMDINTPSHQQCVLSHIERNASRILLEDKMVKKLYNGKYIKKINYLDPLDIINN